MSHVISGDAFYNGIKKVKSGLCLQGEATLVNIAENRNRKDYPW